MTWLQIFYVAGMYFMLAEVLYPYIDGRAESFTIGIFEMIVDAWNDYENTVVVVVVLGYMLWPLLFFGIWLHIRRQIAERVANTLTGRSA